MAAASGTMIDSLDSVVVTAGKEPQFTVIWLHGLGADGHDFEPIVPALGLSTAVRFVFPHAPVRPVTINQGAAMRAWYDILTLDRLTVEDEAGIRSSQAAVNALIEAELTCGIDSTRIILAGFSQGGAIALHTGLRFRRALGGIMVLSAYLPLGATLATERAEANAATPIFMAHGSDDPVLPQALAVESLRVLQQQAYAVEWHSYSMAHSVCGEEVEDISRWLRVCFAAAHGR